MNILIKVDSKNTKRYSYHNILDCHLKLKSILIYIITLYIYIYPHNVSDLLEFNSKISSVKNKRQKRKKIATRSIEFKQIPRQVSIGQHSHSYKIVCNIVR